MCFGGSKSPAPAPAPPSVTDPEVEDAMRKEREWMRRRRGRRSTILTGAQGLGGGDNEKAKTTLGG